MHSQRRFK